MKEGWEVKKFGEVVDIINGKNQKKVLSEDGQYPIYGSAGNLMGYATDYLCEKGTTIIGRKGNISNPIFIEEKFWNVDTAFGLYPKNGCDPKFINYLCQTIDFKSRNRGTTIPSLVKSDLLTIEVPFVSSLPEQERIVSILDSSFAAIDKAKSNAEQNLRNSKELFESYLQRVFEKKGDDWDEKTLQELLDDNWITSHLDGNHGGDYPRKDEFVKSGVSYISANCLQNGYVNFEKAKYLTENRASKLRKGIAQDDDVLFAHNATVGPTALLQTSEEKVILGTSLTYYRCNKKYINPIYLLHYLRSNEFKSQYELIMRQSTRNQVPITKQRTFTLIIPPLVAQNELVPKLSNLITETEKLQSIYLKKIFDLEELKKAILQKAFAGELETEKAVVV